MKKLSRETSSQLRAGEILFSYGYHLARLRGERAMTGYFSSQYKLLIEARRSLALFQHHDAITGTSKQVVMHDYGIKLFDAFLNCRKLQKNLFRYLLTKDDSDSATLLLTEDYDR